jgi:hypothetical protein
MGSETAIVMLKALGLTVLSMALILLIFWVGAKTGV